MNAKDSFIGTARRIVAEAVRNDGLAERGVTEPQDTCADAFSQQQSLQLDASLTDENRFGTLLGQAALRVWSDLPREAQEQLFAATVGDGVIANSLAVFLHE